MEGLEEIKNDLQTTVKEVTGSLATKEQVEALENEKEALKNAIAEKDAVIQTNKESIATLDSKLVELQNAHKQTENEEELEGDESFAKKIATKIFSAFKKDGVVKRTVFKAGTDVHTINESAPGAGDGVSENVLTWFSQLFSGISFRRRAKADYLNSFTSVPLVGTELMKLGIKDNETLPVCVGECELKPTSKVDIELYRRKACKVAEAFCFSDEYKMTFRNLFSEILNLLRSRVARAIPKETVKAIIDQSVDFQNTLGETLDSTDNAVDAVEQVVCEVEELTNCDIDQIHMSRRTLKGLRRLKDKNGRPLFSCCNGDSAALFGDGIKVYINNDLPDADGILFLDSSAINRATSNEITVEEITDKDDRMHNKSTYLFETWFGIAVHPCEQACVVYDTLTDIKTQLGVTA